MNARETAECECECDSRKCFDAALIIERGKSSSDTATGSSVARRRVWQDSNKFAPLQPVHTLSTLPDGAFDRYRSSVASTI